MSRHLAAALGATVLLMLAAGPAAANSSGWPGATTRDGGSGCVGCHGSANTAITVAIGGPSALLPGQMAQFSVNVGSIDNAAAKVGFNLAVTKTAAAVQPLFSLVAGEPVATTDGATQTVNNAAMVPLKTAVNGAASYLVNLTMDPDAVLGSSVTLHATANVGRGATQEGWRHANNFTLTVGPPTPASLTPDQANATATAIALSWSGSQGEHFRVLRKTGSYPTSATDAGATLVYEGANASALASGLTGDTLYYFAAYGKAPAAAVYSAAAAQATAATRPPNPATLAAVAASPSEIGLSWTGTSSEFRVLGKAGAYPASPTDASAKLVYQGSAKASVDAGLAAGTSYFYRVWGKVAGAAVYSVSFSQATTSTTSQPVDRHVDAALGSDGGGSNACTEPASPCRTITRAMAAAGSGDTLLVRPGSYDVALGEVFPITFKSGVQLESTQGPELTFIDGAGDPVRKGLLRSTSNASTGTRLEGFTLRNGLVTPDIVGDVALGGALYVNTGNGGLFTVTGNVFRGNEARGYSAQTELNQTGSLGWGGAIAVFAAQVNVVNNVFAANLARGGSGYFHPGSPLSGNENGGEGAGGALFFAGTGLVANNTFHANLVIGGDGGTASNGIGASGGARGGAISAGGNPAPNIVNNLFSANAALAGAGSAIDAPPEAGALSASDVPLISHNLFHANLEGEAPSAADQFGSDALYAEPRFHAAPGVLKLRLSSPANGSGTPAGAPVIDLAGVVRPDPPARGAFEASILSQEIVFGGAPTLSVDGSAMLQATPGGSSAPLLFASLTPSICSVAGSSVSGVAAGTCQVSANQAGDADHSAAPQATQSFAVLATPSFALAVSASGAGSGRISSSPAGIDCGGVCSANFVPGTQVTLLADADAGSSFAGWNGEGCSGTGACVVTLSQARTVQASFVPLVSFAVSISGAQEVPANGAPGAGSGTAVVDPVANTISYWFALEGLSGALQGAHLHGPAARGASAGVKIDLAADPFVGTVVYAEADEADLLAGLWYVNYHTAAFPNGELRGQLDNLGGLFTLQVARSGDGFGSVSSSPPGTDCGSICSTAHAVGSIVVLTATPGAGSAFAGWSGACDGVDPVCQVTMSQARNVTAHFQALSAEAFVIFGSGFED